MDERVRARANKLAHKLGLHTWDQGDESGFGGEYVAHPKAVDTIEIALKSERDAEREQCCKDVCFHCRFGNPVNRAGELHKNTLWHQIKDKLSGTTWEPCRATPIRTRVAQEKKA